jgi:hypothetical protein
MKTPPLHLLVVGTILVLLMYLLLTEWFSEPQREHLATKCYGSPITMTADKGITLAVVEAAMRNGWKPTPSKSLEEAKTECSRLGNCTGIIFSGNDGIYFAYTGDITFGPRPDVKGTGILYPVKPCSGTSQATPRPMPQAMPQAMPQRMTPVAYNTTVKPPKNLMRWLNGRGEWVLYWEPPDVVNKYGFTVDTSDGYKYQIPERTGSFHYYNLGQHTMGGVSFVLRMSVGGVVKSTLGFPVPTTLAAGDAKIKSWRAIYAPAPVIQSPQPTVLYASVTPKVAPKGGAANTASAGNSELLFWDNFSKRLLRVLDRWAGSAVSSYDQVPLNTMPFRHPSQPANPNPISNISR